MFRFEVPASVSIGSVGVGNEVDAVFGVCQERHSSGTTLTERKEVQTRQKGTERHKACEVAGNKNGVLCCLMYMSAA